MAQQVRRVVTGLDKDGNATVLIDEPSPHVHGGPTVITEIWTTQESPATYDFEGDRAIFPLVHDPAPNGSIFRVLEFAPGQTAGDASPEEVLAASKAMFEGLQSDFVPTAESVARHPSFHKTNSVDYITILSGRLTMLMDGDEEVTLGPGDCIVQQGVMHGWRVEGDEPVRLIGVLIDAVPAKPE